MNKVISLILVIGMLFAVSVNVAATSNVDPLCFTANLADSTIQLAKFGAPNAGTLWYSTDKSTWNQYNFGDVITLTNVNDSVYFIGDDIYSYNSHAFYKFIMTGSIAASGSINSLLNSATDTNQLPGAYCFLYLFDGCTALTKAPKLPATSLTNFCYEKMFKGCTSLTVAPELKTTILSKGCYYYMFEDCTGLTSAPKLASTNLANACYSGMFHGCSSLTQAPKLPATTLFDSCYSYMFVECTSLTNAPELKVSPVVDSCYCSMFYKCSSLNMAITTDKAQAIWEFPTPTNATMWNNSMIGDTAGETTDPLPGTMYACLSYVNYDIDSVEEFNADPETDIEIDGKTISVKYGNNTVVVDEKTIDNTNGSVKIDFSTASVEIDKVIIKSNIVNSTEENIEFITKNGYAIVNKPNQELSNSMTITLAQGCATYLQKRAMTGEVIAEVKYGCTSNNKALDIDAKIYVPCNETNVKVFYLIDNNTIGTIPCEVIEGYCVFDKYQDGTYVIVK